MSKVEEVLLSFKEGFSCSQVIPFTYGPELNLDRETAMKISAAFGAGLSRSGNICGAVSSAIMVISLKHGYSRVGDSEGKEKIFSLVNEFIKSFIYLNGSVQCSDLIGCDLSTDEGLTLAREKNLFHTVCPKFIADAAILMEPVL